MLSIRSLLTRDSVKLARVFLALSMIALVCSPCAQVSAQVSAKEKKFRLTVRELPFAGKPFRYQFWIQREQDQVASMELVILPVDSQKVDRQQLRYNLDLTKIAGHRRVPLTAYAKPPITIDDNSFDFMTHFPAKWIGSIKAIDIKAPEKNQAFVYQLVVTRKNQKPVRSKVQLASVDRTQFEVLHDSNGLSWFTTPVTEVMAEPKDWLPLNKQIKIAKPKTSNLAICDIKIGEKSTPLKLSAPVASWTNSRDGKHLFLLQNDGLLLKVDWKTLSIKQSLQITGKGTQVGLSKGHVIVTDAENKRTWCIDRQTMEVKQIIPIQHSRQIAANRDSETCLIFDDTYTSIVNLTPAKVTHSFPTNLFTPLPNRTRKFDTNFWFCHGKLFDLRNRTYRFASGHMLGEKYTSSFFGRFSRSHSSPPQHENPLAPLLTVSPLGKYALYAMANERASIIETKDNKYTLRTFENIPIDATAKKKEMLNFPNAKCATIDDSDQAVFLGLDSEILQLGINGRKVAAYPFKDVPRKIIASPAGDSILVASKMKAFRLTVKKPKPPAIMTGNELAVVAPDAESADVLRTSVNLVTGVMINLNLNFSEFVQNVAFHPNGNSFFVASHTDQLLEIDLKEHRIKRMIDLEMPVSDFTATSKGLAILLKQLRK